VNEEDSERDRATQVKTSSAVLRSQEKEEEEEEVCQSAIVIRVNFTPRVVSTHYHSLVGAGAESELCTQVCRTETYL